MECRHKIPMLGANVAISVMDGHLERPAHPRQEGSHAVSLIKFPLVV